MSRNSDRSDVPVVVSDTSTSATELVGGSGRPVIKKPEYTVVVPVSEAVLSGTEAVDVRRFLQTATALAADNDGQVVVLGLVTVDDNETLDLVRASLGRPTPGEDEMEEEKGKRPELEAVRERQSQLSRLTDVATNLGPPVRVNAVVRVATALTRGVLETVDRDGGTAALFMRGTGFEESRLFGRSTIDAVIADANCSVFVENVGRASGTSGLYVPDSDEHAVASLDESNGQTVDSVCLPVGTGAHSALAAEAARAIARAADAPVTVIHIVPPDVSTAAVADARDLLRFTEDILGADVTVDASLVRASDTTDAILEAAQSHDVTCIGAPEQKSRLEALVYGSVQETLSEQGDVTVLMAQDSHQMMRSVYYRWRRSVETAGGDGDG